MIHDFDVSQGRLLSYSTEGGRGSIAEPRQALYSKGEDFRCVRQSVGISRLGRIFMAKSDLKPPLFDLYHSTVRVRTTLFHLSLRNLTKAQKIQ